MKASRTNTAHAVKRELAVFLGFLLFGLLVLPVLIYIVGRLVFGDFGGAGFMDFYGRLHSDLRAVDGVAWFLVLSPYLVVQALRLTIRYFRRLGRGHEPATARPRR